MKEQRDMGDGGTEKQKDGYFDSIYIKHFILKVFLTE